MMDLFSPFNPITTYYTSMNWMTTSIAMMIITSSMYWKIPSPTMMWNKTIKWNMTLQSKSMLKMKNLPNYTIINAIMLCLMYLNTMSMLPYNFSMTAQFFINLSMAIPMWMASTLNKNLLTKLTPTGTPNWLTPLMVIIELTSMIIQPITLSIRLTANIMAGHIMLMMISKMYLLTFMPTLILSIIMTSMELMVSVVQAYVFAILICLYSK